MGKKFLKYKIWFLVLIFFTSVIYAATTFHGNSKSHVFHREGCRYYDCKNCTEVFSSKQAALNGGYRPCKVCRP